MIQISTDRIFIKNGNTAVEMSGELTHDLSPISFVSIGDISNVFINNQFKVSHYVLPRVLIGNFPPFDSCDQVETIKLSSLAIAIPPSGEGDEHDNGMASYVISAEVTPRWTSSVFYPDGGTATTPTYEYCETSFYMKWDSEVRNENFLKVTLKRNYINGAIYDVRSWYSENIKDMRFSFMQKDATKRDKVYFAYLPVQYDEQGNYSFMEKQHAADLTFYSNSENGIKVTAVKKGSFDEKEWNLL